MRAELRRAAQAIAACDYDWATEENGVGFSKATTTFGHALADLPVDHWTTEITRQAWIMLRIHRSQLERLGVDFGAIEEPVGGELPHGYRKMDLVDTGKLETKVHLIENGSGLAFRSVRRPADAVLELIKSAPGRKWNPDGRYWNVPPSSKLLEIVAADDCFIVSDEIKAKLADAPAAEPVKTGTVVELDDRGNFVIHGYSWGGHDLLADINDIPGRRWGGKKGNESRWVVPLDCAGDVEDIVNRYDFVTITDEASTVIADAKKIHLRRLGLSSATDADFDWSSPGGELLPYQRAGAKMAVAAKRFLIADEMGLGKTMQAIAVLGYLEAFPAVIVVPASLKFNWEREIQKWLPGVTTQVISGRKSVDLDAQAIVVNYDVLKWHVDALRAQQPKAIIFDEIHKLKGHKAQRTKASVSLAKGVEVIGGLTGTPVINTPVDLISQLKVIDRLNDLGGWKGFTDRYCVACHWGGFERHGKNTEDLNEEMRKRFYVRRLKADVLEELPPKRWSIQPIEMTARASYARAEKVKDPDQPAVAKIAALRKIVAAGKLDAAIAWIEDFLENGQKLVVFAHHRHVTEAIANHFEAPFIIGGVKDVDRQAAVDRFQNDDECKVIVGNLAAMGEGLTLTAASDVVFIESSWTPAQMDQAIDRCHRIGQTDSVTGWVLIVPGTVDEDINELVNAKRGIIAGAVEGQKVDVEISDADFISDCIRRRNA